MFLGCGMMVVGPRRSDGRPRGKGYCGIGTMLRLPKWMSRAKKLNAASNDQSSERDPLYYADASSECSSEGLPEMIASFDPHEINRYEFLKRFRARRSHEKSLDKKARGRRSGAPSLESVVDEKFHDDSGTACKE
jgi:hypothetical protein